MSTGQLFTSESIGYTITVIGALYTAWKVAIRPFFIGCYNFYKSIKNAMISIDTIQYEFGQNGGKSLKDSILRIETLIKKLDYRQKILTDTVPYPVFISDIDGNCIWANTAYRKLVGRDMESILGKGWISCLDEHDRDRVVEEWNSAIEQNRIFECNYNLINNEGKKIHVFCKSYGSKETGYIGLITILK